MITKEEIQKLATLSRIEMDESEMEHLAHEFDGILDYIAQIQDAPLSQETKSTLTQHNILREDTGPHEAGVYTKDILDNAPDSDGVYLKVKNIL